MTTNIWMKRLAAGAMLTAAPALFAIGAAGAGNAATGSLDNGANMHHPTHHETFPGQDFARTARAPRPITTTSGTTARDRHLNQQRGAPRSGCPSS